MLYLHSKYCPTKQNVTVYVYLQNIIQNLRFNVCFLQIEPEHHQNLRFNVCFLQIEPEHHQNLRRIKYMYVPIVTTAAQMR
jgi:hypothetical protein